MKKKNILETDIVIVGGGTIGLFLYSQLKKKFNRIKILEKGENIAKVSKNSNIENKGIFHKGTSNQRAFGIGGNSSLWGGQLVEFSRSKIVR
jgi:L-2-hydroxyglutarate oxidase LhgO|tara:strand:+ start:106 stop:381 length:276 start_codon:yes stop_codon:yes gene_type:complete